MPVGDLQLAISRADAPRHCRNPQSRKGARPTANGFAPEMAHSGVSQDAWLRWFDNSARVTT